MVVEVVVAVVAVEVVVAVGSGVLLQNVSRTD